MSRGSQSNTRLIGGVSITVRFISFQSGGALIATGDDTCVALGLDLTLINCLFRLQLTGLKKQKNTKEPKKGHSDGQVVAGTGLEPVTFGL